VVDFASPLIAIPNIAAHATTLVKTANPAHKASAKALVPPNKPPAINVVSHSTATRNIAVLATNHAEPPKPAQADVASASLPSNAATGSASISPLMAAIAALATTPAPTGNSAQTANASLLVHQPHPKSALADASTQTKMSFTAEIAHNLVVLG